MNNTQNVTNLFPAENRENLRILEAVLFAATQPMTKSALAERLPEDADVSALLSELASAYAGRGVNLIEVADGWAFRTAEDLARFLRTEMVEPRKLSRAALETLAIIAYHQPVTRAEIEDVRGVSLGKGTLDVLLETGWIRMRGRRKTPGRPVTYGTSSAFLDHFTLGSIRDLPGFDDLKAAGFLESGVPAHIAIPNPNDMESLLEDEEPLEDGASVEEDLQDDDEMAR